MVSRGEGEWRWKRRKIFGEGKYLEMEYIWSTEEKKNGEGKRRKIFGLQRKRRRKSRLGWKRLVMGWSGVGVG